MRFNFALIYSFLSASAVLAGVVGKNNRPRQFLDHLQRATNTDYNRVLSGASSEFNDTVSSITGTFSAPSASSEDGTGAYFLVGMGGLTDDTAVFGGIALDMMNHKPHYTAFSWLAPGLPYIFEFAINPGDDIRVGINATSANLTIVKIENLSNANQSPATTDLYIPSVHRQIAGCYVADMALLEPTASNVGLADFGMVTFTDVALTVSAADVIGSDISVIQVDHKNLTSVSVDGNSITITQL